MLQKVVQNFIEKHVGTYCSRDQNMQNKFLFNVKSNKYQKLQSEILVKDSESNFKENSIIVVPSPVDNVLSLSSSCCSTFLSIVTRKSVSVLVSNFTYDSKSNARKTAEAYVCSSQSYIIQAKWHPYVQNLIVILTSDSKLIFVDCGRLSQNGVECNIVNSVRLKNLIEQGDTDADEVLSLSFNRLNISDVLGSNFIDFDFGSCVNSADECLVYLLTCDGSVYQLAGYQAENICCKYISIQPQSYVNYGDDFCSLMCFREQNTGGDALESAPDGLILGDCSGRFYQGIVFSLNSNNLDLSSNSDESNDQIVLALLDCINLNLPSSAKQTNESESITADNSSIFGEQSLQCSQQLIRGTLADDYYFCVHPAGVHLITVGWWSQLKAITKDVMECKHNVSSKPSKMKTLSENSSTVDYILCTERLSTSTEKQKHFTTWRGFFELAADEVCSLDSCSGDTASMAKVLGANLYGVRVSSNIGVSAPSPLVEINFGSRVLFQQNRLDNLATIDLRSPSKSPSSKGKEISGSSDSVKNRELCPIVKHLTEILQDPGRPNALPKFDSPDPDKPLSEAEFIKLFTKLSSSLSSGQLTRLQTARKCVEQHALLTQQQIQWQQKETAELLGQRRSLHTKAVDISERQERVIQRQAALNARLAQLAKCVIGLSYQLTDAEQEMKSEVVRISDRLKSRLMPWLKEIDTRITQIDQKLPKKSKLDLDTSHSSSRSSLDANHEQQVAAISEKLKTQTLEIGHLMRTVEQLNIAASGSA